MPRLQVTRRAPLLSTNLRNAFLEAFGRSVLDQDSTNTLSLNPQAEPNTARTFNSIARRVQIEMKRVTGRFVPISQVVISIHALKHTVNKPLANYFSGLSNPPTPKGIQILITPTSPPPILDRNSNASMSRRRLACNIPALQTQLSIPKPAFFALLVPTYQSPTSPLDRRPLYSMSRRSSLSSDDSTRCPVTPIEQIVHTPLSPPKIPRALPPAPRTWARLNAQMRDEVSPLESPMESFTPYILSPKRTQKPTLNPLRIPVRYTTAGDTEMCPNHLSPGSPGSPSPFESVTSPLAESMLAFAVPRRPTPVRNNSASTSSLGRTALLRASRPHLVRSLSVCETWQPNTGTHRAPPPLSSPISPQGHSPTVALASPFIIRSQELDTEYFRF
ncbi:hypothetical protein C8Q79DRAFT_995326 [Trametes meyenii]|nr:hypothetical protein C8Q79DRAFT_995326 [Trametes meyenii]